MHLIHNEQVKLRATWFNNAAVGVAVAGTFLPFLGLVTAPRPAGAITLKEALSFAGVFVAWAFALLLHGLAVRLLERLRE